MEASASPAITFASPNRPVMAGYRFWKRGVEAAFPQLADDVDAHALGHTGEPVGLAVVLKEFEERHCDALSNPGLSELVKALEFGFIEIERALRPITRCNICE